MKLGWIVVGVIVVVAIIHFANGDPERDQTKVAAENKALSGRPDAERRFVAAVSKARDAYNHAPNDMAKGATRPTRAKEVCAGLSSVQVNDWTGVVASQSSNGDGKGVLGIKISNSLLMKTWNNQISDTGDHTLIEPNTQLFAKAVALTVGAPVKFSGSLIRSDVDCVRESSVTLNGSLTSPEYILRFTDITEIQ